MVHRFWILSACAMAESFSGDALGRERAPAGSIPAPGQRIVHPDVVPGVRLTVEGRRDAVAYRFDVAPGADPEAIRMRYDGADDVRVVDRGRSLVVDMGGQTLRERGLRCFQEAPLSDVACRYHATRKEGGFEVGVRLAAYDRTRRLVIDPVISWSSFHGGSGADEAQAIAVDDAGNLYVAGSTGSTNFPSSGGFDAAAAGNGDAFVAKIGSGASVTWSSYLGGGSEDVALDVAVDGAGAVIVVGQTQSTDFPASGGFATSLGGFYDAFITKVDASGSSITWSSYLGGAGSAIEGARSVAVDGADDIYVAGFTGSADFPSVGGFDSSFGGNRDAFVARIDASGASLAWSTYLGGSDGEGAYEIALDTMGNTYVVGYTSSLDFPSSGGFDTDLGGSSDAFVAKITGSGLAWASYLGGSEADWGYGLAVDAAGDAYVTGATSSTDFPSAGGFDTAFAGATDVFIAKVGAAGSLGWSSYLGGFSQDEGWGIVVDAMGAAYVTGVTSSADFPAAGGLDASHGGGSDAFIARIRPDGSGVASSSFLGGANDDGALDIAFDGDGDVTLVGTTDSVDFPTSGGFATALGGQSDAFVTRLMTCSGDTTCDPGETCETCPSDCACEAFEFCDTSGAGAMCVRQCGDGVCNGFENCSTCAVDCGTCGDGGMPIEDAGTTGGGGDSGCGCMLAAPSSGGAGVVAVVLVLARRRRWRREI